MDESEAIRRLKEGDIGGLQALVQQHQVRAIRAADLITHDSHLAEDVVQDCFLRLCRSIRSFDDGRPFEPWFMRSVVNAAVKAARHAAKETPLGASDENRFENLLGRAESVESQVETTEVQNEVREALQQLSPRQRAAIVQRYYLGMSEKEMAVELDAAPGTVKWLLNAARQKMRARLGERSRR